MYFHRFQEKHRKEGCVGVAVVSHGPVASAMAEVANSIMGSQSCGRSGYGDQRYAGSDGGTNNGSRAPDRPGKRRFDSGGYGFPLDMEEKGEKGNRNYCKNCRKNGYNDGY